MAKLRRKLSSLMRGSLAKGAIGSLGLRLASVAIAFVSSIILARLLGTTGLGSYAFALAVVELLLVPAMFGMPTFLVREGSAGLHQHGGSYVRALANSALTLVLAVSTGIAALLAGITGLFGHHLDQGMQQPLLIALCMLPMLALLWTLENLNRSTGHVVLAQVPNQLLRPSLILLLICVAALSIDNMQADMAIALTVIASLLPLGLALLLWRRFRPATRPTDSSHRLTRRQIISAGTPFIIIATFSGLYSQTDILVLGLLAGADDTGLYRIASRLASFAAFPHMALMMAAGPLFAALKAKDERQELQRKLSQVIRIAFAGALLIGTLLIVFSSYLLGIFGKDFLPAADTLTILCLQQAVAVLMLTLQTVLSLTGHERLAAKNMIFGALLNLGLNLLLIPPFGTEGAAMATLLSTLLFGAVLAVQTKRKLGFLPAVRLSRRPRA